MSIIWKSEIKQFRKKNPHIPKLVLNALLLVKSKFPEVSIVCYNNKGQWRYSDGDFNAPSFDHNDIDISILEDAQSSLEKIPCIYQLNE